MKEYCIYCQISSGKPFLSSYYSNFNLAQIALYDLVELEEKRGHMYYVDNDFFDNKYPYNHNR